MNTTANRIFSIMLVFCFFNCADKNSFKSSGKPSDGKKATSEQSNISMDAQATIEKSTVPDPPPVAIVEEDPNLPPIATDDELAAVAESLTTVEVLQNDNDPDGDNIIITEVSPGKNGGKVEITENGKKLTYILDTKYFDNDSFTYKISDGKAVSQAKVTVTLKPDCRFHLYWPHFYWGVMAEYSTIPGAVWDQNPGQGAICGNASMTSCEAGGYLYLKSIYSGDACNRGRTEICRQKL